MPNRFIKEAILTSPSINSLSSSAERLFYRLLLISDNYGCFEGPANVIVSRCFPLKATDLAFTEEVTLALEELGKAGIVGYWTDNGRVYGSFLHWGEHNPKYSGTAEGKPSTCRRKTPKPPEKLRDSWANLSQPSSSVVRVSQSSSKQEVKEDKKDKREAKRETVLPNGSEGKETKAPRKKEDLLTSETALAIAETWRNGIVERKLSPQVANQTAAEKTLWLKKVAEAIDTLHKKYKEPYEIIGKVLGALVLDHDPNTSESWKGWAKNCLSGTGLLKKTSGGKITYFAIKDRLLPDIEAAVDKQKALVEAQKRRIESEMSWCVEEIFRIVQVRKEGLAKAKALLESRIPPLRQREVWDDAMHLMGRKVALEDVQVAEEVKGKEDDGQGKAAVSGDSF